MNYQLGLDTFKKAASHAEWHVDFTNYEAMLLENLAREARYGPDQYSHRQRAQIVDQLNLLALKHLDISFNEMCLGGIPIPRSEGAPGIAETGMDKTMSDMSAGQLPSAVTELKGKVDFGILTIREDEFQAVLQRFPSEKNVRGRRYYAVSRVELGNSKNYIVAVLRCIEQGQGEAQAATYDLITDLDPHWLVLVGIAGGVPDDHFTLGDVVAATRLHDFSVEAALEAHRTELDARGGPMHKAVQVLLADLPAMKRELGEWNSKDAIGLPKPEVNLDENNFYGDNEWRKKVKESLLSHYGPSVQPRQPLVTASAIASSDKLVKSSQLIQTWRKVARHICAVEMELAGVYQAARQLEHEYPILALRGISDIVGFKRHPDWTAYACHSAAAFAYALIKAGPIEPRAK